MRVHRWLPLCLGLLLAPAAAAEEETSSTAEEEAVLIEVGTESEEERPEDPRPPTYSAMGITRASADFSNLKEALNLHLIQGIRIPHLTWISIEIDGSFTIIPGENTDTTCNLFGCSQSGDDLGLNTIGLFAAVKSPGPVFGIARYGFRHLSSTLDDLNQDASGDAWSAGGGYRWKDDSSIEFMYTDMAPKLEYLTLSFIFAFGR